MSIGARHGRRLLSTVPLEIGLIAQRVAPALRSSAAISL